ncbi:unnamed protein product [Paramecium primaurelia]|uniref:Protein kinase domain-containing protein n=1 Tax=Paramecium primaurelia TaxID=5886 RepID=A0A8S1JUR6_PARPR|nr:unnamed protein product [Paramecium primaurelia]
MDVELRLQYLAPQMHIEQISIFITLTTTDNLIQSVSKTIQLKSDQFTLFLFKYGFQIRIVHGWDIDNIEPLDILSIKVLDPHLSFSLIKEKKHSEVDFSPYFFEESHNDKQINLYDTFVDRIKANKLDYIEKHLNKEIANQTNKEGWTLLHWICYFGKLEILKVYLPFCLDINQETLDGWTALMISIRQQHLQITRYLLNQQSINPNLVTQQSSALHLACRMENTKIIQMLQEKDVDFLIQDRQNTNVFNIASLKMQLFLLGLVNKMPLVTEIQLFSQINPFIAKGTYFSPGSSPWTIKQRYLVINPLGDHLIRYTDKCQTEIRESIKLSQIQQVNSNYSSFKLKKGYFYIQLQGESHHDLIIGLPTIDHLSRWSALIKKGITYTKNVATGLQLNNIFIKLEEIDLDSPPSSIAPKRDSQTPIRRKISDLSSLMPKLTHQIPKFKDFVLKSLLMSDQISCIFKAYCELDGSTYALKCLNKQLLIQNGLLGEAIHEVRTLTQVDNPYIIQLQYAFQTPNYLYLAFEHCNGGSLYSILNALERITINQAKYYLSQILIALEYLHSQNIIYNNLCLNNVLLTSKGSIKLIGLQNYGFQSIYYKTPEYLDEGKIGKWTDYYQFGILAFELLSGCHPFQGNTSNQIILGILTCQINYPQYFSKEAINLINKLTNKNYEKRINFEQIRQHPFFNDTNWEQYCFQKLQNPIRLNQLRNYLKLEKITFQDEDYELHDQINFKKVIQYDYIKFT